MLRRLLVSQRGVALPVVMGCLLVLTLLSGAMLATALRSSADAGSDHKAKRALAAADAGLQTAAYRLRKINPDPTMCMTTVAVAPTNGECPGSAPEAVGTGTTFSYVVSPAGAACGSLPGYTPTPDDRCVTSTGVVNDVQRRVQARVELGKAMPFAYAGVVGTDWVKLTDNVTVKDTDVGSNGPITMTGSPGQVLIDAVARPYPPGSLIRTGSTSITGGIVNATLSYGLTLPDFTKTLPPTGTNNNAALNPTYYDATKRSLTIPAGKSYVMPAGVYNLCSWTMGPGSKLDMESSTAVGTVYLDSPRRPGSGCQANTGRFIADGNGSQVKINNGRFDANVTVYVYGTTDGSTDDPAQADIVMANSAHIDAVWYAPNSIFHATNSITMHGGVAARKVIMDDSVNAKLDHAMQTFVGPGTGLAARRGWWECKPKPPVPTDPESGC